MPSDLLSTKQRTIGALKAIFAIAVLVPIVLFAAAAWQDRRVLVEQAEQRTIKTAAILQQQAMATVQIYELIFREVQTYMTATHGNPDSRELYALLRSLDDNVGQVDAVFVLDRDGKVIGHSRSPPPLSVAASDRDYFIALREGREKNFIGAPVTGRLSGEERLNISHRLDDVSGNFAGAVVVSIDEAYFAAFHRTIRESANDVMALMRGDGLILVRSPRLSAATQSYVVPEFLTAIGAADSGVYRNRSSLDGVDRTYAFHKIGIYPLYVAFGFEMASLNRSWYEHLLLYAAITVPAVLLLLVAAGIALRRAQHENAMLRQLRVEIDQRAAAEAKRTEAEMALRQAQKMEALGQLTGGIAHDFNNLLTVVAGNIDLVISRLDDPEIVRRLEASLRATERGQRLTQQLLTFARRRPMRSVSVNLRHRLLETVELVESTISRDIPLVTRLQPDLWDVEVDAEQLEVALLNLIVNARDAITDKGEIAITAANVTLPLPDDDIDGLAGDFVALGVTDSGTGIPAEILPRVFEPFFTTKSVGKGSGLGLAQVYGFARESKGAARIDSAPGRGTTVTLYLPRAVVSATLPASMAEIPAAPAAAGRILVVEDDPAVADVTVGSLQKLGYATVAVDRAGKAIELLGGGERFDLVFSDIVMPEMNGVELADMLARLYGEVAVLLTTGDTSLPGKAGHPSRTILIKPYSLDMLKQAIDRCLAARAVH
ncbi:MAG TPA: ATP-binding protein [Stellaceae bacterium]|nr:ATP-binding protein [Stellaceae bacterium]